MKKLILGFMIIASLFATPIYAQDILATEDTDYELRVVKDSSIEFCNADITRYNRIELVEQDSGIEYYYLAVANFSLSSGQTSCFYEYEIVGTHLYAVRPYGDAVCQVEYSRIYCWDIHYENEGTANIRIYGKQPDQVWDFSPTLFQDNYTTWIFYYFPNFLGIVTR